MNDEFIGIKKASRTNLEDFFMPILRGVRAISQNHCYKNGPSKVDFSLTLRIVDLKAAAPRTI